MKTLKKTLAVASAVAVVAASAAVMGVSASAETGTITFGGDTVAYDGSSTYTAYLSMTASADATAVGAGFICDEGISFTGECSSDSFAVVGDDTLWWAAAAFTNAKAAGTVLSTFTMQITLSDDQIATLESGTDVEFYVYPTNMNGTGATDTVSINDDIKGADVTVSPATVTFTVTAPEVEVVEEEEEEEEEEDTPAPIVQVVETVAATETPVATGGSPKTGDALPIAGAGVAVIVAIAGGVAIASKKRK